MPGRFGVGMKGSRADATGLMDPAGITPPRTVPGTAVKLPARNAGVGTLKSCVLRPRIKSFSYEPKKNSLSLMTGAPMVPPNWLKAYVGAGLGEVLKTFRAINQLKLLNSNTLPWICPTVPVRVE